MISRATPQHLVRLVVFVLATSLGLLAFTGAALAQVDEGDTQIINIRETDGRLGPLVYTLIGLGCVALLATVWFWWLTRPGRVDHPKATSLYEDGT